MLGLQRCGFIIAIAIGHAKVMLAKKDWEIFSYLTTVPGSYRH